LTARIKIVVSGLVQGVGFRYFTYRIARKLGLAGYVHNKADGGVEVVAEGGRQELLRFLEELRIGPSGSSVESVTVKWEEPKNDFHDFRILK